MSPTHAQSGRHRNRHSACRAGCAPFVHARRRWTLGLICFAAGAVAAQPPAQSDGDPDPNAASTHLHLARVDAGLELESRYEWRRVDDRNRDTQRNRLALIEETLTFDIEGDYIDPGVFLFNVMFGVGLDQQQASEHWGGRHEHDYDAGWLGRYDIRAELFANRPLSAEVYASRQDARISRNFLPSLQHERTLVGTSLRWADETTSMRLTFEQSDDDYDGRKDSVDNERLRETSLQYEVDIDFTERHQLHLDAGYTRLRERYEGSRREFLTSRSHVSLDDVILFGDQGQHELATVVYYQEEQGELGFDQLEVGPQLTLRHSDALETRYQYQYTRENFDGDPVKMHRGEVGLTRRWSEFATSTFDLYGQVDDDSGADTCAMGGSLYSTYSRPNPWGRFSASGGYWYDHQDFQDTTSKRLVVGETVRLKDPLIEFLAQPDVTQSSVRVTSQNRRITYVRGRDYRLIWRGDRTGIVRVANGRIEDGQTVLVFYRYRAGWRDRLQTHQVRGRVQQRLNCGLTPYYALTLREQVVDGEGDVGFRPLRQNRHRLGVTYDVAKWSAGAELELNDETLEPYTAGHVNANWTLWSHMADQLDWTFTGSQFHFTGGMDRDTTLLDVGLDHRYTLAANVGWKTAARYRFEHDTSRGDTHGVDVETALDYRIGDLTVSVAVEYDSLRIATSEEDGVAVWLKVRRDLPNLLGAKR